MNHVFLVTAKEKLFIAKQNGGYVGYKESMSSELECYEICYCYYIQSFYLVG
jgi:hypothetical protein